MIFITYPHSYESQCQLAVPVYCGNPIGAASQEPLSTSAPRTRNAPKSNLNLDAQNSLVDSVDPD